MSKRGREARDIAFAHAGAAKRSARGDSAMSGEAGEATEGTGELVAAGGAGAPPEERPVLNRFLLLPLSAVGTPC
jgi:hypothetical protein